MSWSLTGGHGRARNLRYEYSKLDPEAHAIPVDAPLLLSVFNYEDMSSGFARISLADGEEAGVPSRESMAMGPYHHTWP